MTKEHAIDRQLVRPRDWPWEPQRNRRAWRCSMLPHGALTGSAPNSAKGREIAKASTVKHRLSRLFLMSCESPAGGRHVWRIPKSGRTRDKQNVCFFLVFTCLVRLWLVLSFRHILCVCVCVISFTFSFLLHCKNNSKADAIFLFSTCMTIFYNEKYFLS